MQSDYEEQKLLAEQRLAELEKLTENYKGSLEEIEKRKMEVSSAACWRTCYKLGDFYEYSSCKKVPVPKMYKVGLKFQSFLSYIFLQALQIPESAVLQSVPYRTLQSQYSVIFNELNLVRRCLCCCSEFISTPGRLKNFPHFMATLEMVPVLHGKNQKLLNSGCHNVVWAALFLVGNNIVPHCHTLLRADSGATILLNIDKFLVCLHGEYQIKI